MNHQEKIQDFLDELSVKVGVINFKDKEQQYIASEILTEMGGGLFKDVIMSLIVEAGEDDKYTSLGYGYFVRKGDEGKEDAQKYKKDDRGNYIAISPKQYQQDKEKQGAAGEKAAAQTPQNKQGSDTNGDTEAPEQGTALKGKGGDDYKSKLPSGDPASTKKEEPTQKKSKGQVYGNVGEGDVDIKNNMLKYGFGGYQAGTDKRPAPGSAGSAFNEIVSGEGIHMIGDNTGISEEELARKMYDEYKDTALGKEQSRSSGVGKIPEDIENGDLYSKCVIAARSARTKYDTTQARVKTLQEAGKFGSISKLDTYYGAEESLDAQVLAINDAKSVLLPNGTEVSKEDAVKFVRAGGGGMNPSDTATFASDKNGNLLIQFHSDKTSTADIQDNSTLIQEGENYKTSIDNSNLTDEQKQKAKDIVDEYSNKISSIEENYNNQTTKIATRLLELPIDKQIDIIKKDKGTLKKNIDVAIFGKDGKPKKQFKEYLPSDTTIDSISIENKYDAIRKLVAEGNGKANEIKVITKVGLILQSKDSSIEGIDVKSLISEERAQVVNLQRERIEKLNEANSVDIDGVSVPLGTLMEAEETIRGFHLTLMDYPPKNYENGNPSSMVGSSLDINMGGTQVNGKVLRDCIGVNSTTEFKKKFILREAEELVTDKEGNVTGKTVFVYAVDTQGRQVELGKKTYRSKSGATGKTNNTFTYSSDMQKCFKSK